MKKQYIAPDLTAVIFRAERGYAASSNPIDNVAQKINEQAEQAVVTAWGDPDGDQNVYGYNQSGDPHDGMAAGYFYTESTEGWFGN